MAEFMGIADSTLRDRLEKKNLTPDDLEKIAVFFGRTIAYYFDLDEKQEKVYVNETKVEQVNELCANCKVLEAEISKWKDKYIYLLENGTPKKEMRSADSA
ncbi:MAG: hypothetical protein IT271_04570 [Chitinophagales bacterium]|nr:hypothetical protein [Chitinophagales bacterium]